MKFCPPRKTVQKKLLKGPFCNECGSEMTLVYSFHETRSGVVKRYGEAALVAAIR